MTGFVLSTETRAVKKGTIAFFPGAYILLEKQKSKKATHKFLHNILDSYKHSGKGKTRERWCTYPVGAHCYM